MRSVLERDEQKALVRRCELEDILIISIENSLQFPINAILEIVQPFVNQGQIEKIELGLKRLLSILTQKRYSQGMFKGCPDLYLPKYNLWIELKQRDGGVVSLDQQKAHRRLRSIGDIVEVCHGAKEAWEVIKREREKQK